MSTLTPTLPEIQTPLIPAGSFATQPLIAEVATQIHRILPDDKQKEITDGIEQREQQKAHLTTLLEDLKLSEKYYDFSDYEDRLLLSDSEIENILETEIFRKNGEMTELGKSFYEYQEMVTKNLSEEMKVKMKRKLVKEFKLDDRVYESSGNISWWISLWETVSFINKKQFFQDIKKAGLSWIRSLDLSDNSLYLELNARDFFHLVKLAGLSWIRSINLWHNDLSENLDAQDFFHLVKEAGLSWIRSLNFSTNEIDTRLDAQDFFHLVKEAGLSWIRSLNLWLNNIFTRLDAQDFFHLVKEAGLSWIRSLHLGFNGLSEKLDAQDFFHLVKEAGLSWIRSLNLFKNELSDKLESPDFFELVKEAGFFGIKSLDLWGNDLSDKLSDSQKQELDNIAEQYNMKLDYSN